MDDQSDPLHSAAAEIRRGVVRLGRRMQTTRPAGSLSGNRLGVLDQLHRRGRATAGELAAAEYQKPQSLTRVFAELEQDGLIIRTAGEQDRRQSVLAITDDGRAALARDMAARDAWLATVIAELTETERDLLRLAARLMDRLAGGTAPGTFH
jgi:DNA-binding MarR family transcriptional regulator